jgi:hypothetical protein
MTSKIEQELIRLTGHKPNKQQDRQAQLKALAWAVYKGTSVEDDPDTVDDAKWHQLSKAAQDWYNAASDAVEAEASIADFDDDEEGDNEVTLVETKTEKPTKRSKAAKETKEKVAKPVKEKKAAKVVTKAAEPEPKKAKAKAATNGKARRVKAPEESASVAIRRMVVKHPDWPTTKIHEALVKEGHEMSALLVASIKSATESALNIAAEHGWKRPRA